MPVVFLGRWGKGSISCQGVICLGAQQTTSHHWRHTGEREVTEGDQTGVEWALAQGLLGSSSGLGGPPQSHRMLD